MVARPTASDQARYRTLIDSALEDTATVVRTNAVQPCIITADTREVRLPGLPSWYWVKRWRILFENGADVVAGDHVLNGTTRYCITEVSGGDTFALDIRTAAVRFLASASGSIRRNAQSITHGQTADNTTPLPSVTFRSFSSQLIMPTGSQFMQDEFDVQNVQGGWVLMDYPPGNVLRFPAQPNDRAVIGGVAYPIRAVQPSTGFVSLFLDIPATA